jgi:hypothetical protein
MKRLFVILLVFGAVSCRERPPDPRVLRGAMASAIRRRESSSHGTPPGIRCASGFCQAPTRGRRGRSVRGCLHAV